VLPNPGPGKLIVMEGLDGAGTSTQSPRLAQWLRDRGIRVYVTNEPTPGAAGMLIRPYLTKRFTLDNKSLAALFSADRLDHLYTKEGVLERLRAGEWVIMDRYYLSSFAYQSLSLESEELRWLWHLHEPCLIPDVTFFLDVPVPLCLDRIAAGRAVHFEIFEKADILETVRDKYLDAIKRFRSVGQNIQMLDGTQPIKKVHSGARERVTMMFLDDTYLSWDEQQQLWLEWPNLKMLVENIEANDDLGLSLVTVKKIPESVDPRGRGGSRGGYQLEFGSPTKIYHIAAFFANYYRILRLRPLGSGDKTLERLKAICPQTISRTVSEQLSFNGGSL